MDVLKLVNSTVVQWGLGLVFGGIFLGMIRSQIKKIGDGIVLAANNQINSLDDPDLKEMARHAIRYAAKRLPNSSGSDKMQAAIKAIQDATPNFIISDAQIKELIQNEYDQIKGELETI